jgi:hypothetical protein
MRQHAITILFLVAAIVLYAIGFSIPANIFVGLGILAELTFWVRLFRSRSRD